MHAVGPEGVTLLSPGSHTLNGITYHGFRAPAIIATTRDHLVAFAEGRVNGNGDFGDIDDEGVWTAVNRTSTLKPANYVWDAVGPANAIRLDNSDTLVVPAWGRNIISFDGGISWGLQTLPKEGIEGAVAESNDRTRLIRNDRANEQLLTNGGDYKRRVLTTGVPASLPDAPGAAYSWHPTLTDPCIRRRGEAVPGRCHLTAPAVRPAWIWRWKIT